MKIGVVGLGLIGGSMAKAFKQAPEAVVLGADNDPAVLEAALKEQAIDEVLDENNTAQCALVLIALYPEAVLKYLRQNAARFAKDCIVIDLCGVKQKVCGEAFELAEKYGFHFIGGHPMAGTHKTGFAYSRANMFIASSMILVPKENEDEKIIAKAEEFLAPAGFGRFTLTTAAEHDHMIAFTSQLAHVVSNAYIKSPTAEKHKGFSAGSYKDLTRVAWLNEVMWTELFLDNKEALLEEIDQLMHSLGEYRQALAEDDADRLQSLLKEGRLAKERVDGI